MHQPNRTDVSDSDPVRKYQPQTILVQLADLCSLPAKRKIRVGPLQKIHISWSETPLPPGRAHLACKWRNERDDAISSSSLQQEEFDVDTCAQDFFSLESEPCPGRWIDPCKRIVSTATHLCRFRICIFKYLSYLIFNNF
jgi:hypothetical protein